MERSFARGCRYGLKRARWRRLWRVQIQEYLTAAVQNIMVLLGCIRKPQAALSLRIKRSCTVGVLANRLSLAIVKTNGTPDNGLQPIYVF